MKSAWVRIASSVPTSAADHLETAGAHHHVCTLEAMRTQALSKEAIMNQENRLKSFDEFWPYYVREHSSAGCRSLHFIGSTLGLVCLSATFATGNPWLLPLGLFLGYGFAWVGHFVIERNRPATFQYPLWSFQADWKMWRLMLLGRMEVEVRRLAQQS